MEEDEDQVEDVGESKFGEFASTEFGQAGFGTTRSQAAAGDETIRRRGAVDLAREEEWDLEELTSDTFDVQAYLKRTLTGADKEEIKRFTAALQRYKQQNARDLQRNVFKQYVKNMVSTDISYAEFVLISKEISTLENDMLELKELLGQWKDLPQLMGMDDTLAPVLDKSGNGKSQSWILLISSREKEKHAKFHCGSTTAVQSSADKSLVDSGRISKVSATDTWSTSRL